MDKQQKEDLLTYISPFLNIEKLFPLLPGTSEIKNVASFIGIDEDKLRDVRKNLDEQAKEAALEILNELDDAVGTLESLPFKDEDTVLVIGDSIAGDRQGWFEILRHLLEIGTDRNLKFINSASYQFNSTDALKYLDQHMMAHNPDWVFVALGTFDAYRPNYASDRTMVSLTELWENMNSIQKAVQHVTKNDVIWVSPTPVKSAAMEKDPLLNGVINNQDIAQIQQLLSDKNGYVVDPYGRRFGNPPEDWNYLSDGLHHSITGHTQTVKKILEVLSDNTKSSDDA